MFKNAIVYALNEEFLLPNNFNQILQENALRNLQPNDAKASGFVSPFDNTEFLYSADDCHLFQYAIHEKIIPQAGIKNLLSQKEKEKIAKDGTGFSNKQKQDLKNQIYLEQLPGALSKVTTIFCYIDLRAKLFVVDARSSSKAEEVARHIRQSLGSFKIKAFHDSGYVRSVLSNWVKHNRLPDPFSMTNEVLLKAFDDTKATIKASNIELSDEQMNEHINSGYQAAELGLDYANRLTFTLGNDLSLKKLKLSNCVLDELSDMEVESKNDEIAARFSLFSQEIRNLWKPLYSQFNTAY